MVAHALAGSGGRHGDNVPAIARQTEGRRLVCVQTRDAAFRESLPEAAVEVGRERGEPRLAWRDGLPVGDVPAHPLVGLKLAEQCGQAVFCSHGHLPGIILRMDVDLLFLNPILSLRPFYPNLRMKSAVRSLFRSTDYLSVSAGDLRGPNSATMGMRTASTATKIHTVTWIDCVNSPDIGTV